MAPPMERETESNCPQSAGKIISERKCNLYGLLIAQQRNMLDCSVAEAQDVGPHTEHHLYCSNAIQIILVMLQCLAACTECACTQL